MQQFRLLHAFPPAAIDVTAMDAEHVVDADEEERDLLGLERAPGAALRGPLEDMEKVQRRGE